MELNHYSPILRVSEVHYDGYVVIGTPNADITVAVGDELVLFERNVCHSVKLESIQLNGRPVQDATGDGATEVGFRLSKRAQTGVELRKLRIPTEAPKEIQLKLEDSLPTMLDEADTDVAETVESEGPGTTEVLNESDQPDLGGSEEASGTVD